MDFAFLPPEINSARMYTGPGAGPLLAAAGTWDSLSAELDITAASYESVISGLSSRQWRGPSSDAMSATAAPYRDWLYATAAQAQQMAMHARAAAAAYEMAYAMTVPPAAVTANRTQLALLVATNFFGQNTGAIAVTEAQYGEYWAQDTTAMAGYATTSATATQLPWFGSPRQTTNPEGLTAQTAAVAQANVGSTATSQASQTVSGAASSFIPTDLTILNVIQACGTTFSGTWKMEAVPAGVIGAEKDMGLLPKVGAAAGEAAPAPGLSGGPGLSDVNAMLARAGRIGPMSVPAGWAAPTGGSATASLGSDVGALPKTAELARAGSGMPGIPGVPGGAASRATGVIPRYGMPVTVMARPPAAG